MIVSMDTENHLTNSASTHDIKPHKSRNRGNVLDLIKGTNQNPTVNIINNDEKQCFLSMTGNKVKSYGPNSTIKNCNEGLSAVRGKKRRNKRQINWKSG